MEDVLAYLHSKGIRTKRATGDNVHCACFYHGEAESERGRLYVNVDPNAEIPGLHTCFVCGERGALAKIKRHFGDPVDDGFVSAETERYTSVFRVLSVAARYYHERLLESEDKMEWLRSKRGLTDETIKKHLLGWADGRLIDHFAEVLESKKFSLEDMEASCLFRKDGGALRDYFCDVITIPYFSFGSVALIRGKVIGGKYLTPPGAKTRLYNVDALLDAENAVITEGEFDALIAEQMGFSAVGVPGANVFQETWNSMFERLKRVYAVFDNDTAGREGIKKVRDNLGYRLRSLTIPQIFGPEDHNDLSAWIVEQGHTKADFEQLLMRAEGGLLVTVDDAFYEHDNLQAAEGVSLGLNLIDVAIRPGLLPAQLVVIEAKTGAGKTLILLNIFHRFAMIHPDKKILFVSLEQTRGDWFERARRIWAFYNRDVLYPAGSDPFQLDEYTREVNTQTLDFWRDRIMLVDKNRVTPEELEDVMVDYEVSTGGPPDLIAVDYLGYWARAFRGRDNYERTTEAVMSAKAMAKDWRIPLITPSQVSRAAEFGAEPDVDQARDSGAIEETADFVFMLWSPDSQKGKEVHDRTGEVFLKIGKSRHGGVGMKQRLQFAPVTLALVPIEETAGTLTAARRELDYYIADKAVLWQETILKHRRQSLGLM